jgi:CrcB protein
MLRLLLVTGFLGGFTTFSAFSLESLHLLQKEQWGLWALHVVAHVLGALACCALGWRLLRAWLS